MGLSAELVDNSEIGWFQIFATPPGGARVEITTLRGAPVQLTSMASSDPFGDSTATLAFPQVTIFDRPGQGDLDWLVPYANIDIYWHNLDGYAFSWEWEGFIIDESVSITDQDSSVTVECKGALYKLDNYLAKPGFPQQPIPYEILIREAFDPDLHPGSDVHPLRTVFPTDWATRVSPESIGPKLWFLRPWGVLPGQLWTGLTSRSTGSWEPALTSFVQGLLTTMFDEGGSQWTVRKDRGRAPVLYLRTVPFTDDPDLLTVRLGTPGINLSLSRDFTQSANVIFGAGTDTAGSSFSGATISTDGRTTTFEPFASSPAVYPDAGNPRFNANIARKEVQIQFPQGMDELSARDVARAQYYRFADPGFTGTITLTTDPVLNDGRVFPRMLIKAGRSILVKGLRGGNVLMHITESTVAMESGTVALVVDSKYRDQLTVQEVRERTRDALTPLRLLKPTEYTPTTQDMLLPWSYTDGSGCLPEGSKELFTKLMAPNEQFPWTHATTRFPPKNYPEFYVKIHNPQRLTVPEKNWALNNGSITAAGIPIRMSQAGSIRLSQFAAYDANGNVLPVEFHLSIYDNRGVSVGFMPWLPNLTVKTRKPPGANYPAGKPYPFFEGAFEQITSSGSTQTQAEYLPSETAGFQMGWGNYNEPAGYSPGLQTRGAPKTGKLQDEQIWGFDTTKDPNFDPANPNMTPWKDGVGMMYAMIYCDDYNGPVYFLGRFFRSEPGQA